MRRQIFYKIFLLTAVTIMIGGRTFAQDLQNIGKNKAFALHGGIGAGLNYYRNFSTNSKDSAATPSFGPNPAYFLQANLTVSIYGYAIPLSALITSQDKSFNGPFSRFGLSPSYRWAKLYLGWQSLNFSQFTLSGQQIMGIGAEINPGKFRLAFMYGKFNNAIADISQFNNLNSNTPLYKRKGFAAKIGYGSTSNFIELSYLQAKDDSSSIPQKILDSAYTKPAANQVVGMVGQVGFLKSFYIRAEVAASYYTSNTGGDTLMTDNSWTKFVAYQPQTSSRVGFAGEGSINYQLHGGNVNFKYRRVDPNYASMGAFYMQTDLEQYTFGLNYGFLKNKIHFSGNIGWQKNNLAHVAANETKRTIGNIALNISPSNSFGIDLNYSNYGISQQVIPQLTNPSTILRYDSVRISQVNQSVSISPHVLISSESVQHSISLMANFQLLNNEDTSMRDQDFSSTMMSLVYALIFPRSFFSITNSLNYFNTAMTGNNSGSIGYNLGVTKTIGQLPKSQANKRFLQSVNISVFGGYFSNLLNSGSTGNTITLSPSVGFAFPGKQSVQFLVNYSSINNKKSTIASTQQMMFSGRYNVSF